MSKGWLVNDLLTCIPGTRTFWNDLLDWFPDLVDMTGVPFYSLADQIERSANENGAPDYIIRNATYFRKMNIPCKTISLLQDIAENPMQKEVLESSDVVVVNSAYTLSKYTYLNNAKIIPLGTDFNHFRVLSNKEELRQKWGIRGNAVCFIGAQSEIKGWSTVVDLIKNGTDYQFVLVLKDEGYVSLPVGNYTQFHRVSHQDLVEIINACDVGICTSVTETQHLAGIEMGACGLPITTTNVGVYYNLEPGDWGCRYVDPLTAIDMLMNQEGDSRSYWLKESMDRESCRLAWKSIIDSM